MGKRMTFALRRSGTVVFVEDPKIYHPVLHSLDLPPGTFMEYARGSGKLDNAFP
jgi:hypothetical protein